MPHDNEQHLAGGNLTQVTRSGETILRTTGFWSPSVHRLLQHVRAEGFTQAPIFWGHHEDGREILSFVPGSCPEDYPFMTTVEQYRHVITSIARLLRQYHDATASFVVQPQDRWLLRYPGTLDAEVICHNDIAPYNVTFVDGHPYGLIDFDTACPAPRIWDIAYALYRFVPLSAATFDPKRQTYRHYVREQEAPLRQELVERFFAAYGCQRPVDVFDIVIQRLQNLLQFMSQEAAAGNVVFQQLQAAGHAQLYHRDIAFIRENQQDW